MKNNDDMKTHEPLQYMNNAATLPSFHRVATDHNKDNTTTILRSWLIEVQIDYHYVEWRPDEESRCVCACAREISMKF